MILVIDNYDSFTYNLVQYLGELGADVRVRRNDQVTLGEVEAMAPEQLLISPDLAVRKTPGSRPTSSADSGRRRRSSASVSVIRRSARLRRRRLSSQRSDARQDVDRRARWQGRV